MDVLLEKIIKKLNEAGYIATIDNDDILIETEINKITIQMVCKLGNNFPYEIPSIIIPPRMWDKLPCMPHKYSDGSICTFDRSVSIPNFNEPVLLVLATVDRAKEIIIQGIEGKNKSDYIDEYKEYWKTKALETAQTFLEDYSNTKEIYWIIDQNRSIIADSYDRTREIYYAALGNKKKKLIKGLLIPIRELSNLYIPKTDKDILSLLKNTAFSWKKVNAFFQNNISTKEFFIIMALNNEAGTILLGWHFYGPGIPKGFRKGKANLGFAFNSSKQSGNAIAIDDCSQKRLYSRGGNGKEINIKEAIIIGCGAIGSIAVKALMDTGVKKFALVDNDILTYENIARHYAGYFWVGQTKVEAIKTIMQLNNPNLIVETFNKNAFSFLKNEQKLINQSDLLVVAVAYAPLEQFLIEMINQKLINSPTIIIWVEPYTIAGHAIVINYPMDFYQEIFDRNTLEYKYKVIISPEQYNKRESGCQTTFMPYSAFDLNDMVYRILGASIKNYIHKKHNYRITWIGDIASAKKGGIEISSRYMDVMNYSLEIERID